MPSLTKWQRVEAALHGGDVDRTPIALWKHYHLQDRSPLQLASATLALQRQFDTDLIKLTPNGLYFIQDWGATIQYGRDDDFLPLAVKPVVASVDQWSQLPRLDVNKGALRRELEAIHHVAAGLDGSAPFLMTLFNPLTIAYKLAGDRVSGDRLAEDLRQAPQRVHAGLRIIRDLSIEYAAACLEAGASGFFFATQLANTDLLTRAEYEEFGVPYDLDVLAALQGKSRITMLHVCRANLLFDLVAGYPVDVINWASSTSGTTLADARRLTDKPLAAGLSLETLLHGTEADVAREVHQAIVTGGQRLILAPECVVKGPTPDANLTAARHAAEQTWAAS
jgi:uroporphyrinogen decarboxylase